MTVMSLEEVSKKVEEAFKACINCRFLRNKEPNSPREHVWYNHLCTASPLERKRDPYDGKLKHCAMNSSGLPYFLEEREDGFMHSRDVNIDGTCPKYQRK